LLNSPDAIIWAAVTGLSACVVSSSPHSSQKPDSELVNLPQCGQVILDAMLAFIDLV